MADKETKKNWFARHKVLTVILAIIAIAIIANLGSSGSKSGTNSSSTKGNSAKADDKKAAAVTAKIGEQAKDGKFEFTVSAFKCGETSIGDEFLNRKAQGQFCRLSMTVKNIGNEKQTLSSSDQYLYNDKGQKFSADDTATIYAAPDSSTWFTDINPGNSANGDIIFDVPAGVTPTSAELHDSAFSGGIKVTLQ